MDSRKSVKPRADRFTMPMVQAIRDRFLTRLEGRVKKGQSGKRADWSYSVIRNKSKMQSRLERPIQPDKRKTAWELAIGGQRGKLIRLLDPYDRWAKRERYILKEINDVGFPQYPVNLYGYAWGYAAALHCQKLRVTTLPGLRDDSRRMPGWGGVKSRANSRLPRLVAEPIEMRGHWDCVIGGYELKLHWRSERDDGWRFCIERIRRRLSCQPGERANITAE